MATQDHVILIRARVSGCWAEVLRVASEELSWPLESGVTSYIETLAECCFRRHDSLAQAEPPANGFEGRVFGSDCELRWVSRGQGEFDAWLLREYKRDATPARLHALNVEKSIRNYYLLGLATDLRGEFREARYPDALFVYPIELNFDDPVQAERTRAFVEVAEYRRSAPTWDSLSDISQINDLLDAPLLVAHRFVTIRSDRRPAR